MMKGNVKNAPEGRYFREIGYSQSYPWVEVKRTAQTITLHKVMVEPDPEWKPNILPGGFCGHCDNQHEQTWLYGGVDAANVKTIRLTKGDRWTHRGVVFQETDGPYEFYDYNF